MPTPRGPELVEDLDRIAVEAVVLRLSAAILIDRPLDHLAVGGD